VKAAITLITLGVIGLMAYAYDQLTTVTIVFHIPGDATLGQERDWTIGLVWGIAGAILLGIGVYRLSRSRKAQGELENAGE
jgi:putative exporter of polyketide antibiotics